ncbi:MAG: HPr family phosphocarrier protein [Nitrospinota bacterium]
MSSESIYEILLEEEFLPLVQNSVESFYRMLNFIGAGSVNLSKRYYSDLMNEAEELETMLDDYAALENRTWAFFRELVASVRNLTIAGFQVKHILVRLNDYGVSEREQFLNEAEKTLLFINKSIYDLGQAWLKEGQKNGLVFQVQAVRAKKFRELTAKRHLPKTMNSSGAYRENRERILEFTRKYRKVYKIFKEQNLAEKKDREALKQVVPTKIDEKKAQKLKNMIHNVQSDYDTYIKNTDIENTKPILKAFRGYISIPLHLLEATRWLSHFYERHGDEIKNSECNIKISSIVEKLDVLDRLNNFTLYYSGWCLQKGNKLAEEILSSYVENVQYELPVPTPLGFHARPTTYISMIVNEHGTDVSLIVEEERFNAKSILNLMEAGGMIADLGLKKVVFEGDKRVLDDLKILAESNYCEDADIPRELNYLRIIRNIKNPSEI